MSPIEKALLDALKQCVPDDTRLLVSPSGSMRWSDPQSPILDVDGPFIEHGPGPSYVYLARQVRIDSYVADFAMTLDWCSGVLVIECDGFDFHDRTKQQAAYDRSRDRDLLRRGVLTIRFTGSEIKHSPERCAAEVYETLDIFASREMERCQAMGHGWERAWNELVKQQLEPQLDGLLSEVC